MSTTEFTSPVDLGKQPQPDATPAAEAPSGSQPPAIMGERGGILTLEHLAYLLIGLAAIVLHVWNLGDRALHHDETLHAAYSWYIYVGRGYTHDPLLHGPFLYYFGALLYFLFGDNDFTARLGVAIFGTLLTLSPFLVRRELGRPAALLAALYLLISPVYLYTGRLFRHDMYSILFEILVFVGIVRYATTRQSRWLYLAAAAFGLMYANQETSYLYLLIMGTPLILLLLWRVYKPGIPIIGALGVALVALVFVLPGEAEVDASHTATRDETGQIVVAEPGPLLGWGPLETEDNSYALRIRNHPDTLGGNSLLYNLDSYLTQLWQFFRHPAILIGIGLLLATIALLSWLIWFHPGADGLTNWQRTRQRDQTILPVYGSLSQGWRWLIALAIFFAIYTLLFTAFFHNVIGIISGTTGSLLYWLAQHNVERGSQPPYYYLVLLVVYEPLLVLWTLTGIGLVAGRVGSMIWQWRAARDAASKDKKTGRETSGAAFDRMLTPHLLPMLLVWWTFGAFGIYTWAGEKMPWLLVHVALPMVLLSAWAFQQVLAWGFQTRWSGEPGERDEPDERGAQIQARLPLVLFGGFFAFIVGFGYVQMADFASAGGQMGGSTALLLAFAVLLLGVVMLAASLSWGLVWSIRSLLAYVLLMLSVPVPTLFFFFTSPETTMPGVLIPAVVLLMLALLALLASFSRGWRWSLAALALCITLTGGLYSVRNAFRVSFQLGDVPREMLIYTQTSPDVMHVVRQLEEISRLRHGTLEMPIIYDNETVWQWYLRDFPNATSNSGQLNGPPDEEVQAVLMLYENIVTNPDARGYLTDFRVQRLPLRWWFPESDMYDMRDDWRTVDLENASLLTRVMRAPFDDTTMVRVWDFLMYRDTGAPLGSTDFVVAVRPALADQIAPGLGAEWGARR